MATLFGSKRTKSIRSIGPKRVVPRSEDSTSKSITKPRASAVSTTASSKVKSKKASFAVPVKRAPVKSARFTKASSLSKVTKKSPIGSVSTGRTMRRTVDLSQR